MSIDEFTALHGLVLKKAGQAEEVAEVLGASEAEVTPALDAAVAEKRAMAGRGKYMVTPGRARVAGRAVPGAVRRPARRSRAPTRPTRRSRRSTASCWR